MFSVIIASLIICGIIYLGIFLTISLLKNYRKRKGSKIFIANVNEMMSEMTEKQKAKFSMDDLERMSDSQVIAEYDEVNDEVVQIQIADKGTEQKIKDVINQHDGYIVIED